jgi:hypothetical protein
LHHEREAEGPGDCDDVKLIGAFSTKRKAEEAIFLLLDKPGFKKHQAGFSIDEYEVDEVHWLSGFGQD